MSIPSMELPVLYALTHPERVPDDGVPAFDPVEQSPMTFERVARDQFPTLELGISAGRRGGAAPAVFNAANECAVARYLSGKVGFDDIPRAIESALSALGDLPGVTRDDLLAADAQARRHVEEMFKC
jgi:1-deoxy-D-xylulose-5-phosphate reductoisomerase